MHLVKALAYSDFHQKCKELHTILQDTVPDLESLLSDLKLDNASEMEEDKADKTNSHQIMPCAV